jgi:hypothetical protein
LWTHIEKRRSFYLRFEFPTVKRESEILSKRASGTQPETIALIAGLARALRALCLTKPPSISEMLDLAQVLELMGLSEITSERKDVLLPVLIKTESDRRILMMSGQWESILYDALKYRDEIMSLGETACALARVSSRSI